MNRLPHRIRAKRRHLGRLVVQHPCRLGLQPRLHRHTGNALDAEADAHKHSRGRRRVLRERGSECPGEPTLATSRGLTMIAETKAAPAAESARSNIPSSWSAPAAGAGPEEEGDGEDEPWCEGVTPPERSTRAAAAVIQVGREPREQPTIAPDWLENPRPRRLRSRSGIRAAWVAMRPRL